MTLMQGLGPGGVLAKNVNDAKKNASQKNLSLHLSAQAKSRKNFNKTAMMKTATQSFVTSHEMNFKGNTTNQIGKPQRFNSSTPRENSQLHSQNIAKVGERNVEGFNL